MKIIIDSLMSEATPAQRQQINMMLNIMNQQKYDSCYPCSHYYRHAYCKLRVLCLMVKYFHTGISTYRAARKGKPDKRCFRYTPLSLNCFPLIHSIRCKCYKINQYKPDNGNYYQYLSECHGVYAFGLLCNDVDNLARNIDFLDN